MPKAHIVHYFGRADLVGREALSRLVRSISRFVDPADAITASTSGEVAVLDSRPMGSSWLAGQLWERLGIAAGILKVATDRRVDAELVERVIFSVANLLNLEVDLLFFDTSSTYWETDRLDDDLDPDTDDLDEDGGARHVALKERGTRAYNSASKDHRPDLPQVVLAMAVTRQGIPVRVWTFPGNESDQVIIRKVKDDLGAWNLSRVIWVLDRGFTSAEIDRGFTSAENRRYLQRGGWSLHRG